MKDHPNSVAEMERRIEDVLRKNRGRLHVAQTRTPLEELLAREDEGEDADEVWRIRVETFRRVLEFFGHDGAHPLLILRRYYAVTKAVAPELIGDMSLEDIAVLCGDGGRATVSARIERVYNSTLAKAGMANARAAFQKTGNYSEPQKGNRNRRKKR